MTTPKSKRPKDIVSAVRVSRITLRRAEKAARAMRPKLTRNGFIVRAMQEKADAVLDDVARAS